MRHEAVTHLLQIKINCEIKCKTFTFARQTDRQPVREVGLRGERAGRVRAVHVGVALLTISQLVCLRLELGT